MILIFGQRLEWMSRFPSTIENATFLEMKIALYGHGKMGSSVAACAEQQGHKVVALDEADVCIDFSHASVVLDHIAEATAKKKPIVVGTTGWDDQHENAKKLILKSGGALLYSPNFSLGVALFLQIAKESAALFAPFPEYDSVGIEHHHSAKKDAPSGTARALTEAFGGDLTFHSVRCGHNPGRHTLLFDSLCDTITLTHEARSREGFALGALRAAEWLIGKQGWYTYDEMVRTLYRPHHAI